MFILADAIQSTTNDIFFSFFGVGESGNVDIYLYFVSFLYIKMAHIVEILPHGNDLLMPLNHSMLLSEYSWRTSSPNILTSSPADWLYSCYCTRRYYSIPTLQSNESKLNIIHMIWFDHFFLHSTCIHCDPQISFQYDHNNKNQCKTAYHIISALAMEIW